MTAAKIKVESLSFPLRTVDPFLFLVYHKDIYPPGNERMEAPRVGNGSDFNSSAPWRMYHGHRIPGFPQHPHRGFETVTATITGIIDHSDSLGCSGRYGMGDLQWMTAGKGIVHGENFPLINMDKDNTNRFFQIWLNLPAANKMVEPTQLMHWAEKIPHVTLCENKVSVTVWAGEFQNTKALNPPSNSWAANPANDVGIFLLTIQPGGSISFPSAKKGTNRSLYFVEGDSVVINETKVERHSQITVDDATATLEISVPATNTEVTEVLVLQGQPIKETVVQHGPFVMNTRQQIQQAFMDYQRTQFGGWPWKEDAVVFPRDKGRFVKVNGKEENPPLKVERENTEL